MNKARLIEQMSKASKLPKVACKRALEAFVKSVGVTLKGGKSVVLTGFGTFKVSNRAAREGINPQTKEKIKIAAMTVPKFTAGKSLKEAVK